MVATGNPSLPIIIIKLGLTNTSVHQIPLLQSAMSLRTDPSPFILLNPKALVQSLSLS